MIKILFFGSIAARLGRREQALPATADMTTADVLRAAGCAGFQPLLVAVNLNQVNDLSTLVKAGDEVAIMPPFSGG